MKKYTRILTVFILFLCVAFWNIDVNAAGNTYYVALTGNDTNIGSQSAPFKTFSKAVSMAQAGDIVYVSGGTYTSRLSIAKSGTSTAPITIRSVSGEKPVIDLQGSAGDAILISGSYISVEGLETKNSTGYCVNISGQHIHVSGLLIHDCVGMGVYMTGQYIDFVGNTVHHAAAYNKDSSGKPYMTSGYGSGIKVKVGGDHILIADNQSYNNYGEGIAVTRGTNITVRNNKTHDNYAVNIYIDNSHDVLVEKNMSWCTVNSGFERGGNAASAYALGEEFYDGWGAQLARVSIVNNIAANCYKSLSSWNANVSGGGMDSITIANNTFWNSTSTALSLAYDSTKQRNTVIENNIIHQSAGKLAWIENRSGILMNNNFWSPNMVGSTANAVGTNDKYGDARFLTTPTIDPITFQLSSISPAINSGFAISSVSNDYFGNSRPYNGSYDIGAHEFTGSDGAPVSSTMSPSPLVSIPCPPEGLTGKGMASLVVNIAQSGNYKVWIQMMGRGDGANSLFLQLDSLYCVKVGDLAGMSSGVWEWVDFQNGNTSTKIPMPIIAAGNHTITLIGNAAEPGVAVDRILFTKNTTCTPTGSGDACIGIVSTPTPTVTPTPTQPSPTPTTGTALPSTTKPAIQTITLPQGKKSVAYLETVVATDQTPSDVLSMKATGLPRGLTLGNCTQTGSGFGGTTITCAISGFPARRNTYYPKFTVTDKVGNSTTRALKLQVL